MRTFLKMFWTDQAMFIRGIRTVGIFAAMIFAAGMPTTLQGWGTVVGASLLGMLTGDTSKSGIPNGRS